jgi:hypothetical protein
MPYGTRLRIDRRQNSKNPKEMSQAATLSAAKRRAVASKMKIKRRPTREQKSSRNLIHRQDL